jgi:hypothetical protein
MTYVQAYGSAEIDYRGERIQLARKYVDYDDYKDDPNNLAPSEIARVENVMTQARIGPDFADWAEFVDQAFKIKFPGYGLGPGPKVAATGREFVVGVIEIPQVGKDRYFVLEKKVGGSLRLVDDFVIAHKRWSAYSAISSIRLIDETLVYSDRGSNIVRETNIGAQRWARDFAQGRCPSLARIRSSAMSAHWSLTGVKQTTFVPYEFCRR